MPAPVTPSRSCIVGPGNNPRLITEILTGMGYLPMGPKQLFSTDYRLKWTQTAGEIDFRLFKEGEQLANHFPNIQIITSKNRLL
jgi:hypothetical protein